MPAHTTERRTLQEAARQAVIEAGRVASLKGWVPATSGNFSVRIDAAEIAITRSGADKGQLRSEDILVQRLDDPLQPGSSAEARLHTSRYLAAPDIGAIFHTHALYSTVMASAHQRKGAIALQGWELQKALSGVQTHEALIEVPVFANDQDIDRLSNEVEARFASPSLPDAVLAPGYLIAGHGLYAFGRTAAEAGRHLEALETLFLQVFTLERFRQ